MPYFEFPESETRRQIEEVARSRPFKWIINPNDPMSNLPLQPTSIIGLARSDLTRSFLDALFRRAPERSTQVIPQALPSTHRKAIADALRVVGKIPKKVIEELKEFTFDPQYRFRASPASSTTGKYGFELSSLERIPSVSSYPRSPFVSIQPELRSSGFSTTPASTTAHEVGHGAERRILGKIPVSDSIKTSYYETIKEGEWEGVAEYLGDHIQRLAGVENVPIFPYGPVQRQTFKELSQMPSKNPYMNVYRYFQKYMR